MQTELEQLRAYIARMVPLTEDAWQDMQQRLHHYSYQKHDLFVQEGKVCNHLAFITQGAFRYYKMIDGVEETTYFSFSNDWVSAYTSFITRQPSYVTVEAIEPSEALVLYYNDLQALYSLHPVFERWGRLVAEHLVACLDERMFSLLLKTPEERYRKVMRDSPHYFERVPQHYIASYLGVAPESLSRIRRRLMKKPVS